MAIPLVPFVYPNSTAHARQVIALLPLGVVITVAVLRMLAGPLWMYREVEEQVERLRQEIVLLRREAGSVAALKGALLTHFKEMEPYLGVRVPHPTRGTMAPLDERQLRPLTEVGRLLPQIGTLSAEEQEAIRDAYTKLNGLAGPSTGIPSSQYRVERHGNVW